VDSAIDAATDQAVLASSASERRRYMCATCYAAVVIKGGSYKMRRHFAHAKGEADPDCTEFFPSRVPYSGRRWTPPSSSVSGSNSWRPGALFFDMTLTGPRLAVWMPEAADSGQWSGAVEVEAHHVVRRMTAQHLQRGQMIAFDLVDGQWSVTVEGEVSEDYLSRLDLGDNSLEAGLNLFDATESPGRKLGPSQALRLGDSVWALTRDPSFGAQAAARLTGCGLRCTAAGWHVFYVGLPDEVTRENAQLIARWLERQIRPHQARVWIESAFPVAHTSEGIPVFPVLPGALEVRSDQPVDLQIRRLGESTVMAASNYSQMLSWNAPEEGRWVVAVNGVEILIFDLGLKPPEAVAPIRATLGSASYDLFAAQNVLDRAGGQDAQEPVTISWVPPSLAKLIKVDGRPLEETTQSLYFAHPAGRLVAAGNLGLVRWPSPPVIAQSEPTRTLEHLYPTARWLISVALPMGSNRGIALGVPRALDADPMLRSLSYRRWPVKLQPQLRSFMTAMEAAT
jgi:hypothetical protein